MNRFQKFGGAFELAAASVCLGISIALTPQIASGQKKQDTLVVGWTEIAPFFQVSGDGELEGYSVDLAKRIGEIANVDIEFRRFDSLEANFAAIQSGESHIEPGIPKFPFLDGVSVYSKPATITQTRVFVRSDSPIALRSEISFTELRDQRIGVFAPTSDLGGTPFEDHPNLVSFSSLSDLLLKLLSNDIGAAIASDHALTGEARASGLDSRIVAIGSAIRDVERVVALRKSKAKLLPLINEALDTLAESGALAALDQKWLPSAPEPPPETLSVGVAPFPPYQAIGPNGEFTGFAVESLREIAARAGLQLQFKRITEVEWGSGPSATTFDILPQAPVNAERRERFDFTLPFEREVLSVFVRAEDISAFQSFDDLDGRRLAVQDVNSAARMNGLEDRFDLLVIDSSRPGDARLRLLDALVENDADAILYTAEAMRRSIADAGLVNEIAEIDTPVRVTDRAIAVRFGLPAVTERLNAVLPSYLVSDRYASLKEEWFGAPVFWTQERVWSAVGSFAAAFALLVALVGFREVRRAQKTGQMALANDVFESSPIGLALFDGDHRLRLFNHAYRALFRKTADSIFLGTDHKTILKALVENEGCDLGGRDADDWMADAQARHQSGDSAAELRLADERVVRVVKRRTVDGMTLGVYEDVTADRAREKEIEALSLRLQLVLDTASNGIVALDHQGDVTLINPAARHMLARPSEEPPFSWPHQITFIDPETLNPLEASKDPIKRTLAGQRLHGEINLMTRSLSPEHRFVRISSAIVTGDDDVQAVVVLNDVTAEEVNRRQIERRSRLDALGQLTGGVAHDFNNLLGTVLSATEVALMDAQTDRGKRMLGNAIDAVKRGSALAKRMLSFAKQTPGQATSKSIGQIFDGVRSLVRPTIEETIDIVFDAPEEALNVYCDHSQLENAILNLVLNSRDAIQRSQKGDAIRITARSVDAAGAQDANKGSAAQGSYPTAGKRSDERADTVRDDGRRHRYIEIAVSDNGPGMSEAVKQRAVEPFFTTKNTNSGTGLGLSMVYGFVQQARGELRIYAEENLGATIRMLLPRGVDDGSRETPQPGAAAALGNGERVLLVEDEPSLLASLTEGLIALGYTPVLAPSGVQALELLANGIEVDLVLTDIVMPGGVGGFELAHRIRERIPGMPIVYMSGYTGFSDEEMGDAVAPLVAKPCSLPELAQVLQSVLSEVKKGAPNA